MPQNPHAQDAQLPQMQCKINNVVIILYCLGFSLFNKQKGNRHIAVESSPSSGTHEQVL